MNSKEQPSKKEASSNYLSFLSLTMGMIQPEWLYMSHFFSEQPQENDQMDSSIQLQAYQTNPPIRIYFRSRK